MLFYVLVLAILAVAQGFGPDERIINGTKASSDFVVSILKNKQFQCAGAVIQKKYVLIPKNCIECDQEKLGSYILRAGSVKHDDEGTILFIDNCTKIPGVVPPLAPLANDLAVLYVKGLNIEVTELTIPRPFRETEYMAVNYTIYGWGKVAENDTAISPILMQKPVQPITLAMCKTQLGSLTVTGSELCTMPVACDGDYGGPLISPRNEIVGIALKPLKCHFPMLYTNVPKLKPEIDKFINENPSKLTKL